MNLHGVDLFGEPVNPWRGLVNSRFVMPPFSVLDARSGDWQDRKRAWISIGLRSEEGRICEGSYGWQDLANHPGAAESTKKIGGVGDGPSIFDPLLCELVYRWWAPASGIVVDPFAGGSVRGIVAGCLGLDYWGCDLRPAQVAANEFQADEIEPRKRPIWVIGDSMEKLADAPRADLIFSCPPYGDLEKYSDDPRDLSAMEFHTFSAAYKRIILRCYNCLRNDSFAAFVVGDFRDTNKGFYRNFVGLTVAAFEECGFNLYNEAILVQPVGSASLRVSKQFAAGRKLCKTHQNLLVFCKGDWRKAAAKCGGGGG